MPLAFYLIKFNREPDSMESRLGRFETSALKVLEVSYVLGVCDAVVKAEGKTPKELSDLGLKIREMDFVSSVYGSFILEGL